MKRAPQPPYTAPQVCHLTGISYRQLDYWARTGFVRPSIRDARGSGDGETYGRLYSAEDVDKLRLTKQLLDLGVSLPQIRRDGDPRKTAEKLRVALLKLIEPVEVAS